MHAQRTDVLVISDDDSLLVELGPLLGDRYRVHTVDSAAGVDRQVNITRWIGIVDVNADANAPATVARLEGQHPNCPLIVINARPEKWANSIDRGTLLAVMGRHEVASAELSDVLLVGEDRLRANDIEQLASTLRNLKFDPIEARPRRLGSVWIGAAVLLIVLAVNAGWLHHRFTSVIRSVATANAKRDDAVADHSSNTVVASDEGAPLAASQSRIIRRDTAGSIASPSAPQEQNVLELLSAARVAFRDEKALPRPDSELRGDSALELYAQVLREDPQNGEALEGVSRLLVIGRGRINADAASGSFEDASRLVGVFKDAGVNAGELQQLTGVISAAQPKPRDIRLHRHDPHQR